MKQHQGRHLYKYSGVVKVNEGTDGKVRLADIQYEVPGENKFRISTRPIHKLVLIIPMEEQTMEDKGANRRSR
jgi:hypothetical protein